MRRKKKIKNKSYSLNRKIERKRRHHIEGEEYIEVDEEQGEIKEMKKRISVVVSGNIRRGRKRRVRRNEERYLGRGRVARSKEGIEVREKEENEGGEKGRRKKMK